MLVLVGEGLVVEAASQSLDNDALRDFPGNRKYLTRRPGTALLLMSIWPLFPVVTAAEGWQSTEWTVFCSSELTRTMPAEVCDDTAATGPAAACARATRTW